MIVQTQKIRCPNCNHGQLVFLFDETTLVGKDPLIIGIRCVSPDTDYLSSCNFPRDGKLFETLCKRYYLSVRHTKDLDKIIAYTRMLQDVYADEISKLTFAIFSEIKSLDLRSVDSEEK